MFKFALAVSEKNQNSDINEIIGDCYSSEGKIYEGNRYLNEALVHANKFKIVNIYKKIGDNFYTIV